MIPRIKPWLLIALWLPPPPAGPPPPRARRAGNHTRFRALADRLSGYVLYGYLEYEILKDWLATAPTPVVRKFLEENSQAPVSDVLRKKWLRLLAARGGRETFIR